MGTATNLSILTVGHSNLPAERFVALLQGADVTAIADVRSVPFSRRFPWFSGTALAARLNTANIAYLPFGDSLGGRPRDPSLYRDGIANYEEMARTAQFRAGLDRISAALRQHRLCLMCAEREPLDCHRCLLVARALTENSIAVGHIRGDGTIEPQSETEDRLLALTGTADDLFLSRADRLAQAYRARAAKVAARFSA
jgi:uncharacterized protein (DUF488 family)